MGEGVVADLVTFIDLAAQQFRMVLPLTPMMKKVAGTPASRRASRICGV
jgi:hypothetical protein